MIIQAPGCWWDGPRPYTYRRPKSVLGTGAKDRILKWDNFLVRVSFEALRPALDSPGSGLQVCAVTLITLV
jgi:hypothetical protein